MIQLLFVDGIVVNFTTFTLDWFNQFIAISRPACTMKNKTVSSYATLPLQHKCYVRRFCPYGVRITDHLNFVTVGRVGLFTYHRSTLISAGFL